MELGAAVENMHAYQGYGFYCEGVGAMDQGLADRGGIMVNLNTERFCDEHNGYSQIAPHVIAQPEHHVYLIFDEANAQQTDLSAYEEKGLLIKADTVAELAEKTGLDAEKLEKVVEEYREGIEKGEDKFNRTLLPESFEAPFYAIYMTADLRHTQGGLVTDVAAHVLTEDNEVIQGLYAAGGVTEGFSPPAPVRTICPATACCRRWSLAGSPVSVPRPRPAALRSMCPIPAPAWKTTRTDPNWQAAKSFLRGLRSFAPGGRLRWTRERETR